MMRRSLIRLVLLLLGVGLVATGCGSDSGDSRLTTVEEPDSAEDSGPVGELDPTGEPVEINPVALVNAAKEQSEAATSLRGEMEFTMTGVPELDFTVLTSLEVAANGDVATITETFIGNRDTSNPADVRVEFRFVGDTVYAQAPAQMIADTPWVSFDLRGLTDVDLDSLETLDTDAFLNYLLGINDEAAVTLGEEVNGILTTRISGIYTMADLLNANPEDQQRAMLDSQQFFSGMGEDVIREILREAEKLPIQLDVWIDIDSYIVRQRLVMDEWYEFLVSLDPSAEDSREEIEDLVQVIDMHFFDYGAPITIEPPPEEDVTHFDEIDDTWALATSGSSG